MFKNYTSWGAFPKFNEYPDILDIEQMCILLGVSTKTGYRLLREGKIEHLKIGRAYRIPKLHVMAYLKLCPVRPYEEKEESN